MKQECTEKRIRTWVSEDGKHAVASMSLGPGGGIDHKLGKGGKGEQNFRLDNGEYVSEGGGTGRKAGTDNEAWRLKEKKYSPHRLVEKARDQLGNDRWKPSNGILRDSYFCNAFVADMLEQAGATVPHLGGRAAWALGTEASDQLHSVSGGLIGGLPPSAEQWANQTIPGFVTVTDPQPGDIATDGEHMGIVSGPGRTISASSRFKVVRESGWGFEPNRTRPVVFKRYTGR